MCRRWFWETWELPDGFVSLIWRGGGIEFWCSTRQSVRSMRWCSICICKAISSLSPPSERPTFLPVARGSAWHTSRQTKLQEHISRVSIRESDSRERERDSACIEVFLSIIVVQLCRRGKLFSPFPFHSPRSPNPYHHTWWPRPYTLPWLWCRCWCISSFFFFHLFWGWNEGGSFARKEPSIISLEVFFPLFHLCMLVSYIPTLLCFSFYTVHHNIRRQLSSAIDKCLPVRSLVHTPNSQQHKLISNTCFTLSVKFFS